MRTRGLRRRKLNNQGFSLVEVLVALAILMIITIPLLHGFVMSARVNAKAKNVLRATTAGGNVMERLKSTDLADYQGLTYEVTEADGSVTTHNVYEYDSTNDLYKLTFSNEQVDGKGYWVEATLDPGYYKDATLDAKLQYNNNSFAEIYDMNSESNAFLIESSTMDTDAMNNLPGVDATNFNAVNRKISIRIKENSGNVEVYGTILYEHGSDKWYGANNQCLYMDRSGNSMLKNVYLIFDPAFLNNERMSESIEIVNENNYPVNILLVKQDSSSGASLNELNYKLTLLVKEGTRSDFDQVITKVRTNVDAGKMTVKYYHDSQYRESVTNGAVSVPAKDLVGGIIDLSAGTVEDRIYRVNIQVFEQESRELLYEMEGTKEE